MSLFSKIGRFQSSIRGKVLFFMFVAFVLILGAILSYIFVKSTKLAERNATELAASYAAQYANSIQDQLNTQMGMARALGHSIHDFPTLPVDQFMATQREMMRNLVEKNEVFLAVWIIWERRIFDSSWSLPYGRGRYTYFREIKGFKYREELLDSNGDNINGAYYKMKISKEETVLNPYTFSYSGNEEDAILETSLCIPILNNNEFIGLAGVDVSLESYQDVINELEPIEGSQLFLLANDGTLVTHPDKKNLGKSILQTENNFADTSNIIQKIQKGKAFSYRSKGKNDDYYVFHPIEIGEAITPWSLLLKVPLDIIMAEARRDLLISIIVGLAGLLMLGIFVWIISGYITNPIKYTTKVLQKLAMGDLENTSKLEISSRDELQDMADSMNTLMDGLKHTAEFARKIGKGQLNTQYNLLSENDSLGQALLEMQTSLKQAEDEQNRRQEEEEKQNWTTEGLALFGDILRKNNDNIKQLSFNIMKNLTDYTKATQGCIYVRKEDDNEIAYELTSAIAYDRKKLLKDTIHPGDGLVGRVVHEKLTIYITDIPDDYVKITSGLGEANPRAILIVPLILNDSIYGAIELVSFHEFESYKIQFVEKVAESIASTISSAKITERTNRLLKESQYQREELSAQEEEMRQNLEELKATQEEAARRETEVNALIDALGSTVLITELNMDGKIININGKCYDLLGVQPSKMIGKHHKNMGLDLNTGASEYKSFWSTMQRGKTKRRISEVIVSGKHKYIEETYIPVKDVDGNIHKIVGIGYDFTKIKERDQQIKELKAQIEELKKNE